MNSPLLGSNQTSPSTSATNYTALTSGLAGWSATESSFNSVASSAGTLSNFYVKLKTAPGSGKSYAFTVRINGSDTGITLTISDTNTAGSDTTHTASVSAGDVITISSVPSGTPTAPGAEGWCIQFAGSTANESVILGGRGSTTLSTTTFDYIAPMGVQTTTDPGFDDARQVVATGGNIKNLYVKLGTAPGSGKSRTFTLYKNGSSTTLTCTVSDAATTANDTTHSVSVAAGDTISLRGDVSGTPAASTVGHGMTFVATTDGESLVMGNSYAMGSTGYNSLSVGGATPTGTEANQRNVGLALTLSKLYLVTPTAWGAGNGFTGSVRLNGADPAGTLTATIQDAATSASDTSNSVTVAAADLLAMKWVAIGAPSSHSMYWGMKAVMASASSANSGFFAFF